ncbi:glycosyltransferase family 1 protein, partial [Streptomyces sp. NPDC059556]
EPDRNREMGEAARRRYEKGFSPSVGLDRLLEEYRTAIAGRSGGGNSTPPAGNEETGSSRSTRASGDGGQDT